MAIRFQSLRRWFGNIGSTGQQNGVQIGEPYTRAYEINRDYGIDGALQVSAVWACVEFLTDNIASLPYFVYQRAKTKDGHKEIARDTMLWKVMHESPNRMHTPMEFWQFLVMNYVLRGNGYARLVRDSKGEVIEMWPLASDQVEVEVLRDRSVVYKYHYEGQIMVYAEDSIFHWRDKGNGVIGMSRLDFMRSSVGLAIDAQNHTRKTFSKSGKRPGVFMVDKSLTAQQRSQIRENFKGLTEGSDETMYVLEHGAKFEPLGMSPVDLQILETRRFSVEDIGRWFGVSGVVMNDTSKATTWGTGIGQIIEGLYKFRLRTILVSLEQAIHRRIYTPAQRLDFCGEFALEALLRGSYQERLEAGSKAVQNGLQTRNEWRQLENLPPMDGANELTAQVNLMPVGRLGQANQPATAAEVVERMRGMLAEFKSWPGASGYAHAQPTPNQITVNFPEIKWAAPVVNVAPADVRVGMPEFKLDAPVINVAAPNVNVQPPQVMIQPPEVNVVVEATMPTPEIKIELPPRKTETEIERDAAGRISRTTQIERDA